MVALTFNCSKVGGMPRTLTVVGSVQSRTRAHDDRRGTRQRTSHTDGARQCIDGRSPWLMRDNRVPPFTLYRRGRIAWWEIERQGEANVCVAMIVMV